MIVTKAERAKEILGLDRDEVDTRGEQRWVRDAISRVLSLSNYSLNSFAHTGFTIELGWRFVTLTCTCQDLILGINSVADRGSGTQAPISVLLLGWIFRSVLFY